MRRGPEVERFCTRRSPIFPHRLIPVWKSAGGGSSIQRQVAATSGFIGIHQHHRPVNGTYPSRSRRQGHCLQEHCLVDVCADLSRRKEVVSLCARYYPERFCLPKRHSSREDSSHDRSSSSISRVAGSVECPQLAARDGQSLGSLYRAHQRGCAVGTSRSVAVCPRSRCVSIPCPLDSLAETGAAARRHDPQSGQCGGVGV